MSERDTTVTGTTILAGQRMVPRKRKGFFRTLAEQRFLFFMSVPFAVMVLIFNYLPIWGWTVAFQKYKPGKLFWAQTWVGLANFIDLFQQPRFYLALQNTITMSAMSLLVNFTFPIAFAILLSEMRWKGFNRVIRTVSYLPHFVSWVVVSGIVYRMLSTDAGPINQIISAMGGKPIQFMAQSNLFYFIVTGADLWKELGWNAIIYLAAIAAIDPELFEAAKVDGAGRWGQIRNITLPGISHIVIVLLILSIGNLINIGFERQFQLMNTIVLDRAQVLELYALRYGIQMNNFGRGAAIGVVNSVVSLTLLFVANGIFRRKTGESVM
jgi:putative aldouronate transport system permease protein